MAGSARGGWQQCQQAQTVPAAPAEPGPLRSLPPPLSPRSARAAPSLRGRPAFPGAPRPGPVPALTATSSSCDPALRPIMRRRARSLPTSPEKRKRAAVQCQEPGCRMNRVRFADALGLELTEVKVFQSGEDPSIPLHVLSRLSINSDLWYSSLNLEFTMQCLVPDFEQPADCLDFSSRLQEQQVCLERVSSSDLGLSGTIQVRNVAFEKQVSVRYTFNQWESIHEVCAHWNHSIPEENGQDQVDVFTFFLPVPPFLLQLSTLVQFAARYQVNGQEYWDNNRGKNYTLRCRTHPLKLPRECEESWIHFI
uniref:Protein phosphatase 1 regulatory subunit 3D n=1 Tax=Junco hyemalis TaxID=40217 RepID=A0A8C5J736_JUNHY